MPEFRKGDMWKDFDNCDLFLITANSTLKNNGELVMGAGIAKEAKIRFPELPLFYGDIIKRYHGNKSVYGILAHPDQKVGLFQTKANWRHNSSLHLIEASVNELLEWCEVYPDKKINLNYPAIGKGQLSKSDVFPIISKLPNNVTIWEN